MIRKIIHIDEEKCNGCGLCSAGNERTQEETPRDYRLCTVFM